MSFPLWRLLRGRFSEYKKSVNTALSYPILFYSNWFMHFIFILLLSRAYMYWFTFIYACTNDVNNDKNDGDNNNNDSNINYNSSNNNTNNNNTHTAYCRYDDRRAVPTSTQTRSIRQHNKTRPVRSPARVQHQSNPSQHQIRGPRCVTYCTVIVLYCDCTKRSFFISFFHFFVNLLPKLLSIR